MSSIESSSMLATNYTRQPEDLTPMRLKNSTNDTARCIRKLILDLLAVGTQTTKTTLVQTRSTCSLATLRFRKVTMI
ncbi:hypothetical protein M3J07_009647 [Ascochyta lentis]